MTDFLNASLTTLVNNTQFKIYKEKEKRRKVTYHFEDFQLPAKDYSNIQALGLSNLVTSPSRVSLLLGNHATFDLSLWGWGKPCVTSQKTVN